MDFFLNLHSTLFWTVMVGTAASATIGVIAFLFPGDALFWLVMYSLNEVVLTATMVTGLAATGGWLWMQAMPGNLEQLILNQYRNNPPPPPPPPGTQLTPIPTTGMGEGAQAFHVTFSFWNLRKHSGIGSITARYLKGSPLMITRITVCAFAEWGVSLSPVDMERIGEAMAGMPHLKELRLHLSPAFVQSFLRCLSGPKAQLAQLTKITVKDSTGAALASFFDGPNASNLQHVSFNLCSPGDFVTDEVQRIFAAIRNCTSITSFDLGVPVCYRGDNAPSPVLRNAIVKCFTKNANIQQLRLALARDDHESYADALKSMLALKDLTIVARREEVACLPVVLENNETLKSFTLEIGGGVHHNSEYSECDFMSLQPILANPASSSALKHLSLRFHDGGTTACFQSIVNLVAHPGLQLESLDMYFGYLEQPDMVVQLLQSIQQQPNLQSLSLGLYSRVSDLPDGFDPCLFHKSCAGAIANLKKLKRLKLDLMFRTADEGPPYCYMLSDDLKQRILESVTNHVSLESLTYEYTDIHNADASFTHDINKACAGNVASKLARKAADLPIQYAGRLLSRMENASVKLGVDKATQAACTNTVLAGVWKNKSEDVIDSMKRGLAAHATVGRNADEAINDL